MTVAHSEPLQSHPAPFQMPDLNIHDLFHACLTRDERVWNLHSAFFPRLVICGAHSLDKNSLNGIDLMTCP